jgi:CheY-like chemotaxis protein
VTIKCPKCSATIDATPDELGMVTCGACGARLRSKTPVKVSVQGAAPPAPAPPASGEPRPAAAPVIQSKGDMEEVLARIEGLPGPDGTVRPGTIPPLTRRPPVPPVPAAPPAAPGPGLETLLEEIRSVRRLQEEMLGLLRAGRSAAPDEPKTLSGLEDDEPSLSASAGRKSVLVIDDDARARQEAVLALQPLGAIRTAADGHAAIAAIAAEKPAVIVLELALGGAMPGRDLVNMVKATMEWVDIPLLLYTRAEVASDEDARIHGADTFVRKGPGSAKALASRVAEMLAHA